MTRLRASLDTWLSACLGLPCFSAGPEGAENLETVTTQTSPVFVTAKTKRDDIKTQRFLKDLGFLEINQQLTFKSTPNKIKVPSTNEKIGFVIGPARYLGPRLTDFAPLFAIDRFYTDMSLPRDWSSRVKTQWIKASDPNKQIVMASINSNPAGFVLFQQRGGNIVIDLIAVSPSHQGQGVGRQLLAHLQNVVCKNQEIVVGTQHDNQAARRLYSSAGFECLEIKQVYHFYRRG